MTLTEDSAIHAKAGTSCMWQKKNVREPEDANSTACKNVYSRQKTLVSVHRFDGSWHLLGRQPPTTHLHRQDPLHDLWGQTQSKPANKNKKHDTNNEGKWLAGSVVVTSSPNDQSWSWHEVKSHAASAPYITTTTQTGHEIYSSHSMTFNTSPRTSKEVGGWYHPCQRPWPLQEAWYQPSTGEHPAVRCYSIDSNQACEHTYTHRLETALILA